MLTVHMISHRLNMLMSFLRLSNLLLVPLLNFRFSRRLGCVMAESEVTPKSGQIFGKQIPRKWVIFAGDCEIVNEYLLDKSDKSAFILLQYINSLLRSFGYVIFANNPISGLIVLFSVLAADSQAGLAAIVSSTLAFFFALVLKQDPLGNLNGFFGYNAVLLGTCSAGLLPQLYDSIYVGEPKFWLFLVFAVLISVYFTSALANLLRYLGRYPIPCFLLPFNFLQYILIFCLLNNFMPPTIVSRHLLEPRDVKSLNVTFPALATTEIYPVVTDRPAGIASAATNEEAGSRKKRRKHVETLEKSENPTGPQVLPTLLSRSEFDDERNSSSKAPTKNETHWNWGKIFAGTVVSVSQIYGLNFVPGSVFMFLALIIYSPTTTFFCYMGSLLATLLGITFASNPEEIYNGLWGYNGLLCAGALAGLGFVLTLQSTVLALTAVVFSTVLQHYMTPLFLMLDVPVLTMPFNITTIIFLFVTSDSERALPRPLNLSFPEKHRVEFKEQFNGELKGYLRRARVAETYISKYEV